MTLKSSEDSKPIYCPLCGALTEDVHNLNANVWKMQCENPPACGKPCVILADTDTLPMEGPGDDQ